MQCKCIKIGKRLAPNLHINVKSNAQARYRIYLDFWIFPETI